MPRVDVLHDRWPEDYCQVLVIGYPWVHRHCDGEPPNSIGCLYWQRSSSRSQDNATTSKSLASTERGPCLVLNCRPRKGYGMALTHNQLINCCYMPRCCGFFTTTSEEWASMERQQFLHLNPRHSKCCASPWSHNQGIGRLYWPICYWQYRYHLLNLTINRASTIVLSCILDNFRAMEWHSSIIN